MSAIKTQTTEVDSTAYDETPYASYPFANTAIEHLKTIAHIFDLNSPELETARVLELGCASGGNLIPQALRFPKAKFVGVDLSPVQTEEAMRQIKALGLTNIEIRTASITDIDESYGEFDYIISHGVLSWVPDFVREAIFAVSSKRLSPTGIAYISYNTLPGWHMVRSMRDMMRYHSTMFANPEEKIQQSFLLLQFIRESVGNASSPYAGFLQKEIDMLSAQDKSYLRHDHLEEVNHQYYFHEFIEEARKHGLQYLGDGQMATMHAGNTTKEIASQLSAVTDLIESEQYLDFINNRRFRSTVLCKDNIVLNRNINIKKMYDLFFITYITPELPAKDVNLTDDSPIKFYYGNSQETSIIVTAPTAKVTLYCLSEKLGKYLSIAELIKLIGKNFPEVKLADEILKEQIALILLNLIFKNVVTPKVIKPKIPDTISTKPQISKYNHLQLKWNNAKWMTNQMHEKIDLTLNPFTPFLLKYLDGKHTEEMLCKKMLLHINNGDLALRMHDEEITDASKIKKELANYIRISLEHYLQIGLIVG